MSIELNDLILALVEAVSGILGILVIRFVYYLTAKAKDYMKNEGINKYLDLLDNIVAECVTATNQTYVNSLKESNAFDADAQKAAFSKTKTAILEILGDAGKAALEEVVGDMDTYIDQKIEATVNVEKE